MQGVFSHSTIWQKPKAKTLARSPLEQTSRWADNRTDRYTEKRQTQTDRQTEWQAGKSKIRRTDMHRRTCSANRQQAAYRQERTQQRISPISVWSPAGKSWRSGIRAHAFSTCSYLSEFMGSPIRMLSCKLQFWIQGS